MTASSASPSLRRPARLGLRLLLAQYNRCAAAAPRLPPSSPAPTAFQSRCTSTSTERAPTSRFPWKVDKHSYPFGSFEWARKKNIPRKITLPPVFIQNTVQVRNLPEGSSDEDIASRFRLSGLVESITREDDKTRALVRYSKRDAAERAPQLLSGTFINGKRVLVSPAHRIRTTMVGYRLRFGPSHHIILRNLSPRTTDEFLERFTSTFLQHSYYTHVGPGFGTPRFRGFAVFSFHNVDLAVRAMYRLLGAPKMYLNQGDRTIYFCFYRPVPWQELQVRRIELENLSMPGESREKYKQLAEALRREEGDWDLSPYYLDPYKANWYKWVAGRSEPPGFPQVLRGSRHQGSPESHYEPAAGASAETAYDAKNQTDSRVLLPAARRELASQEPETENHLAGGFEERFWQSKATKKRGV